MKTYDLIIIGAGAAGLICCGRASELGCSVLLLEKNEKVGRKIGITGKGRCNVTNLSDAENYQNNIVDGGRFMYSSLKQFGPEELMRLIEANGTPLKLERGKRVFPVSDKAFHIIDALLRYAQKRGADIRTQSEVKEIRFENGLFTVFTENATYLSRKLAVATGGLSYPTTGSTGDGYRFVGGLGHEVIDPQPSLVSLETSEKWTSSVMGLSLKNAELVAEVNGKKVYSERGEMLFTHFGVSGPLVLSASAFIAAELKRKHLGYGKNGAEVRLTIDLKPAVPLEELEERIRGEIRQNPQKIYGSLLAALLPGKLEGVYLKLTGIPVRNKMCTLTQADIRHLAEALKRLELNVTGTRGFAEAVVTQGGINLKEINPKTMESKLVPGLYVVGELLDIDALTGGFNLQLAFSTGFAAGSAVAEAIKGGQFDV